MSFEYFIVGRDITYTELEDHARGANLWALDIETTGLDPKEDLIRCIQVTRDAKNIYIVPWHEGAKDFLAKYISNNTVTAHNVLFERRWLEPYVKNVTWHDTFIMSRIVEPYEPLNKASLEWCGYRHVGKSARDAKANITIEELTTAPLEQPNVSLYCAMDAFLGARLFNVYSELLRENGLEDVYNMELEFSLELQAIEDRGFQFDKALADSRSEFHIAKAEQIQQQLHDAGLETMGTDKLGAFLFEHTQDPKLIDKGKYTVKKEILDQIDHPYCEMVRRVKQHKHLSSTYYKNPQKFLRGSRMHPTFHQMGAETGRMSCTQPNVQNIPVAGRLNPEVVQGLGPREAYIAKPGYKLVSTDYSQIEPRFIARHSGDEKFAQACAEDFYTGFYPNIDRGLAKVLGLSFLYGAGDSKMAKASGLDESVIAELRAESEAMYPRLYEFAENLAHIDKRTGVYYSRTPLGRKTYYYKHMLSTKAVNSFAQPGAGDVLKQSVIKAGKEGLNGGLLALVHDERIDEVPIRQVDEFIQELNKSMTDTEGVPHYTVESVVGNNYGELK